MVARVFGRRPAKRLLATINLVFFRYCHSTTQIANPFASRNT
jgi:hypothetical protein